MFKQFFINYNAWRNQRKLQKARKLILEASPQKLGTRGLNKMGTVMKLTDIHYSVRKNKLEYKYSKIARGISTNR